MVTPLLFVMNPRRIAKCIDAIESLSIDKVWFQAMTEYELQAPMEYVVEQASALGYTHILLLSDDTAPTQYALDLVLGALGQWPVVTGYCNLDSELPYVNITKAPFERLDASYANDYRFYTRDEADKSLNRLIQTWFAGACLTGMHTRMWQKYPFRVYANGMPGFASDWMLSTRLQKDRVPIVAPRGAFVAHTKEKWNSIDKSPEKRLLIGEIPAEVRWDVARHDGSA